MINHSLLDSTNDRTDGLVMAGLPHLHRFSAWSFTESDMEVMTRFQTRTVSTVGTKESASTYRDCIAHLAYSVSRPLTNTNYRVSPNRTNVSHIQHPFLMHMVLSLTLMHDAHLATSHTSNLAISFQKSSLTHWNTATKLFNNLLSRPIPPSHRDAIWATGALLGTASMAYIESSSPEDAWPLKSPDPNDLNWLRLSEGKRAIWTLADPTRPESIFHHLGKSMNHRFQPAWITNPEFDSVPERLARLFGITRGDTPKSNVYYVPLLCVLNVEEMTLTQELVVPFLMFLIYMESEFRGLLERKDPRGMLLLLWWFRKVEGGDVWWMSRRAKIEGRAIEIWLDRWYGGEEGLIRMFEEVMDGDVGGKEINGGMEDAAGVLMGYPGWGMERVERVNAQVVM